MAPLFFFSQQLTGGEIILKPMSKLDAVNLILASIGGDVINSLLDETDPDIAGALQVLDRVCRDVQTTGWKFNTRKNYKLQRGMTNEIKLPVNTVSVKVSRQNPNVDAVELAGKLFNLKTNSYEFTEDVLVDIIYLFDFENLPSSARNYIARRAAREFGGSNAPDDMTFRTSSKEETDAKAAFMRDQSLGQVNILKNGYR